jgi:uncharacterized protein (TIGR04255 family)
MNTPTRIEPSPLVEAVADVRFTSLLPPAVIFGYMYDVLKDQYTKLSDLPILQLPEEIRKMDPNFISQPHYRLEGERFVLQLGPQILNIAVLDGNYPGWTDFKSEINRIFVAFSQKKIINKITRIGLRYINFFDLNIFNVSTFSVSFQERPLLNEKAFLRVQFSDSEFITNVQVTNDASIQRQNGHKQGSIIDIDTYCPTPEINKTEPETFDRFVEAAHQILKTKFFGGLKEEYVASFNPQYPKEGS